MSKMETTELWPPKPFLCVDKKGKRAAKAAQKISNKKEIVEDDENKIRRKRRTNE